MITQSRLKELLHYDPETGVFTYLTKPSYRVDIGDIAGCDNGKGYLQIRLDTVLYKAHRLAWLYMTGTFPAYLIDHIDGVKSNNRWRNLREATKALNGQNRRVAHKNNESGFLGVSKRCEGQYRASINNGGVKWNIGTFKTPEDAHAAYVEAKRLLHSGSTL